MPELKLKLDDFEIQLDEIHVISLHASGVPSYKLVHFLNKSMFWDLVRTRTSDNRIENPENELEVFSYVMDIERIQWLLVNNRINRQQVWIPKLADVDYWLILTGAGAPFHDLENTLRELSGVDLIFSISVLPLFNKNNPGRKSPFFKYFQSLYNDVDNAGIIHNFE